MCTTNYADTHRRTGLSGVPSVSVKGADLGYHNPSFAEVPNSQRTRLATTEMCSQCSPYGQPLRILKSQHRNRIATLLLSAIAYFAVFVVTPREHLTLAIFLDDRECMVVARG